MRKHKACWQTATVFVCFLLRQDKINSSNVSSGMAGHPLPSKVLRAKQNFEKGAIWLHLHAKVLTYFLNDCCFVVFVVVAAIIIIVIKMYSEIRISEYNCRPLIRAFTAISRI